QRLPIAQREALPEPLPAARQEVGGGHRPTGSWTALRWAEAGIVSNQARSAQAGSSETRRYGSGARRAWSAEIATLAPRRARIRDGSAASPPAVGGQVESKPAPIRCMTAIGSGRPS